MAHRGLRKMPEHVAKAAGEEMCGRMIFGTTEFPDLASRLLVARLVIGEHTRSNSPLNPSRA
eukprot:3934815-Rhodomonas_salina.1